ncbi:ribosomal protein L1p/L10e family-domain-containing protein [Amylostereum chailletii]|nr:ribosomal protein L1p/L10e family-domain-containing protein [Amylostereum chailletii]
MSKKTELIDGHVSAKQCKKAVDALLAHARKHQAAREETELLPGKEQHVWLQVAVKQMHPEHKLKPHNIPVKHPLVDPRTTPVCLITKDPQREYKDRLEADGIKFVNRVVGVTKLKGKFKPFEARRLLLQENGLFLADERIVPLLPALLGKIFFKAKKQPIPVNLTRKDLKGELERAISSTYMHQNQGTCTSVKIAALSHTPAQVLANLEAALPAVVKALKGEWDNVQSLSIKTNASAALPIWSCVLGEGAGGRWDGLTVEDGEESEEEGGSSGEDAMEVEVAPPPAKKGCKKRAAEEQEVDAPKKKAKSSPGPVPPPKASKASKEAAQAEVRSTRHRFGRREHSPPSFQIPSPKAQSAPPQKRRKSTADADASAPISARVPPASSTPSATLSTPPLPKKSKKKAGAISVASGSEADVESSAGVELKGKKDKKERKKARAPVVAEEPATPAAPVPVSAEAEAAPAASSEKKKKRTKKAKAGVEVEAAAEAAGVVAEAAGVVVEEAEVVVEASSISKEELKQKRAAGVVGEKKKEKLLKTKGKKGAKEAVVGKKA